MSARGTIANRARPLLATVGLATVGVVLATWPLARLAGSATLGGGEMMLTAWQLNWYHQALLSDPLAWNDANIFFPYDNTATFNDLLLTHGVITLPVAWVESPVLAFNLALLGGFVLCGFFAHLLIDEVADAPWAATVGGTLFALAPFRFLHLGHLSIAAAWAVPLFLWALLRHLRQPSWGRGALVAVSGVTVGLSSLYNAAYLAPVIPLVILFGARRGPGGRRAWLPLLVGGVAGLALLGWFYAPYATTLRAFGAASAPGDLLRYGADLSSLGQKPDYLGGPVEAAGLSAEARLYPGMALAVLAGAGTILAIVSVLRSRGPRRQVALLLLGLGVVSALGLTLSLSGPLAAGWRLGVVALIWAGPLAVMVWAIAETRPGEAIGPAAAIRLGVAGAALTFVLALGPEARFLTRVIGVAPYWLLAHASPAFEGTRVPARFGGLVMLFLALLAAGAIAALARRHGARYRLAGVVVAGVALGACLSELPISPLPAGRGYVSLPDLREPAYRWVRQQAGRRAILELPEWPRTGARDEQYRGWRALRYMLAAKQHGHHLVNGTGRIGPFLWTRFRSLEPWGRDFFTYITAYFPVDYVLVHEAGIPPASRDAVWATLERGTHGWRQVFRTPGARVYTVDRSFGQGTYADRLYLRRETAPVAAVAFAARIAAARPEGGAPGPAPVTLDLLRDGELVGSWDLGAEWREFRLTVPVDPAAPVRTDGWPRAGVLFRWRARGTAGAAFEIRGLSVGRWRRAPAHEAPSALRMPPGRARGDTLSPHARDASELPGHRGRTLRHDVAAPLPWAPSAGLPACRQVAQLLFLLRPAGGRGCHPAGVDAALFRR